KVSPQRLDIVGRQHIAPRRHVVLAVRHRFYKTPAIVLRDRRQVERPRWILHLVAVAGRTICCIDFSARLDLLRRKFRLTGLLRHGAHAQERKAKHENPEQRHLPGYSGINANVHTEPPVGTESAMKREATLPPRPDSTVTYC